MLAMLPSNTKVGLFHFIASVRRRSVRRMILRTSSMASFWGWSRSSNQASTSGLAPMGSFYHTRNARSLKPLQDLAGVEDAFRIEGVLHGGVDPESVVAELFGEPGTLEEAHAVLAGDRAAQVDRRPEDVLEGGPGSSDVLGVPVVIDERGMQVAVPGMAERPDHDGVVGGDALDGLEQFGDPADGHGHVVEENGPLTLEGGKGQTPGIHEEVGLHRVGRPGHQRGDRKSVV